LEIACVDKKTCLNELIAYPLHFEGYKCDQLIGESIEVHGNVFQKESLV
jgi:hypothetical protein